MITLVNLQVNLLQGSNAFEHCHTKTRVKGECWPIVGNTRHTTPQKMYTLFVTVNELSPLSYFKCDQHPPLRWS